MDKKTFDVLNAIHENCVNREKCKGCEYYFVNYCILQNYPELWDMEKFIRCGNCAEYHDGRCIHYKHEVATRDCCNFFYFKKDGD